MSAPLTGEAARAALPALDGLDFPCALVVTEGGAIIAEAGEVEELRSALALRRRGSGIDAVLANAVRRTR